MLQGAVLRPSLYYLHINYTETGIERSHHLPGKAALDNTVHKRDDTIKKGLNLLK